MASRKIYLARNVIDVDTTGASDGQALIWDSDQQKWIPGDVAASGAGHIIQDEGIDLPQRSKLNFVGENVFVIDDSINDTTIVTISGISGSGIITQRIFEDLTNQISGSTSHFVLSKAIYGDYLGVYYNGIRQGTSYFTVDGDKTGFTLSFNAVDGDEVFAEYDVIAYSGIGTTLYTNSFLDLVDTPITYSGAANKIVAVNSLESGLIFASGIVLVAKSTTTWTVSSSTSNLDIDLSGYNITIPMSRLMVTARVHERPDGYSGGFPGDIWTVAHSWFYRADNDTSGTKPPERLRITAQRLAGGASGYTVRLEWQIFAFP